MKADLHLHTIHSGWRHMRLIHPKDCYLKPAEAYNLALARGMDFVAITDHDSISGALELLATPGIDPARVIMGEELETAFPETGQWVHVSVLGLSEWDHVELHKLKSDVREVCRYCRERGLLYVLNHPFQSYLWQKPVEAYIEDILQLFTHVEGLNGSVPALQNRAVRALCVFAGRAGATLVQVAGSDAHTAWRVAGAFTEAPGNTREEFLAEVKAGRCRVGGGTLDLAGLALETYKIIGSYYTSLYTGRGSCEGAPAYLLDAVTATLCLPAVFGQLPLAIVAANQARQRLVSGLFLSKLRNAEGKKRFDSAVVHSMNRTRLP